MLRLVLLGLCVMQASGVIYRLPQSEYKKMPTLMKVDMYDPCMTSPGDAYCFVHANLFGNLSNPIYNMTLEYSATHIAHYNHTRIHWGICLKQSCAPFINVSSDMTEVVEACLNDTLTRDYDMTARVYDIRCEVDPVIVEYTIGDYVFGAVVLALLGLNALGSLFDFHIRHGRDTLVGRVLLCFSIRKNWKIFAGPSSKSDMQRRIRVIYCFRTISAFLVILGHAPVTGLLMGNNPLYFEEIYYNPFYVLIFNGTLLVQTFFVLSGFLLAYNTLLSEVKKRPTWQNLHKSLIHRWLSMPFRNENETTFLWRVEFSRAYCGLLKQHTKIINLLTSTFGSIGKVLNRLTPAYAFVLFYVMTWARHASGPYQMAARLPEVDDCYKDWWLHLIYMYNYEDNSQCMVHAWYLSADFQLTIVGLIIFSFIYNNKVRKIAIGGVAVVGLLAAGVHTYIQKLHAVLVVSPEVGINFFITDPTFNNLYKRGHTNLTCYAVGMGAAYIIYNLKDSDIGAEKYKKYRLLYWLLPPIMTAFTWLGAIFYIEGLDIPTAVSVVYAGSIKLIFGVLLFIFLFFTVVKVDKTCRGFINWPGWVRLSRLTYFAYLIHVPVLRLSAAAATDAQVHISFFWFTQNYVAVLGMSLIFSVPLFLLLESPLAEAIKVLMAPPPRSKETPVTMVGHIMSSKETIEVKL